MSELSDIFDKHKSNGRLFCYAQSLGPITAKHQFSGSTNAKVLRCTRPLDHDGNHSDGICCYAKHEFSPSMAGLPEPGWRNTERCEECDQDWPCEVSRIAELMPDIQPPKLPLSATWKVGERVEQVCHYESGPRSTRPGVVAAIEPYYVNHERLIVAFDDGETRAINRDVMRHIREESP